MSGLALGALLAGAPASAAPITSLFNTGVNDAGVVLANGAAETHYTLAAVPGGTTAVRTVTSANGFPVPPWLADDTLSAWIGPNSTTTVDGPTGTYDYRTTFTLSGFVAATAAITGLWSYDNDGVDILLNGVSIGPGPSALDAFQSFHSFAIGSGFIGGTNTLDFIVNNAGGSTGLRVEVSGTADVASAVMEPASFAVLGIALLGLRLARRKRA